MEKLGVWDGLICMEDLKDIAMDILIGWMKILRDLHNGREEF